MDNKDLQDARKDLDKEFEQFRKHLDKIRMKLDYISAAGPEDDLYKMLDDLEDEVKHARTGGMLGAGAKGHRKAREKYMEVRGLQK